MGFSGIDPSLRAMVGRQVMALIKQFTDTNGNKAYIGVKGENYLQNRARFFGGQVKPLGNQPRSRALVFIDRNGEPELWCQPKVKGGPGGSFYETDWNNFAKAYFDVDFKALNTSTLNIDHVYPETTGHAEGLSHVRVTALNGPANQNLGRTIEKHMANAPTRKKVVHLATWFTLAKIAGLQTAIVLPDEAGAPTDRTLITKVFDYLASLDLAPTDPTIRALDEHLTRWNATRLQGGDADSIGMFGA